VSTSDERGPLSHGHRIGRDGSRLTVLYDRDCGICGLTARNLARWDRAGRFSIVPLQSAAGGEDPRLTDVAARYALADELHVVDSAGRVASGGEAALAIVDALPGGRLLRPWAAFGPFRRLVSIGYRWIARHRNQIGRWLGLELECPVEPVRPERL
jgi:predicted DCC family thiol-disulfide oxidoreductase YuxK